MKILSLGHFNGTVMIFFRWDWKHNDGLLSKYFSQIFPSEGFSASGPTQPQNMPHGIFWWWQLQCQEFQRRFSNIQLHSLHYHDTQVCSQWDGFISKRVWGSRRGREGLRARLAKQVHHHHSHHEDKVEQAIVRVIMTQSQLVWSFESQGVSKILRSCRNFGKVNG